MKFTVQTHQLSMSTMFKHLNSDWLLCMSVKRSYGRGLAIKRRCYGIHNQTLETRVNELMINKTKQKNYLNDAIRLHTLRPSMVSISRATFWKRRKKRDTRWFRSNFEYCTTHANHHVKKVTFSKAPRGTSEIVSARALGLNPKRPPLRPKLAHYFYKGPQLRRLHPTQCTKSPNRTPSRGPA